MFHCRFFYFLLLNHWDRSGRKREGDSTVYYNLTVNTKEERDSRKGGKDNPYLGQWRKTLRQVRRRPRTIVGWGGWDKIEGQFICEAVGGWLIH